MSYKRIIDYLAAASIVVAFGGLFFGRLMLYPVTLAPGNFLERLAARADAWHFGHQVMLAGMMALIGAAIALRRALRERAPWLADASAALTIIGAALGVGQYSLDFAMLAAAKVESPAAGQEFLTALQSDAFVQWMFYKLPDFAQLGLIGFTLALWRQGPDWRTPAALVTIAALTSIVGPQVAGAWGVRTALGLAFVGFTTVAWKIARPRVSPVAT